MLHIHTIPAFHDNYFWLFHAEGSSDAWIVDPGDAEPVERALAELGLELAGVVVTHHHSDHTGGVSQLAARHGAQVVGPDSARIPQVEHTLGDGDNITLAEHEFSIIEVPGHTLDHIAYHCADENVLFCGDTLFAGGCGRIFEGTPAQMHASLARLAALPGATRVYCAHEYTLGNLGFAIAVEPDNEALRARVAAAEQTRAEGRPTVPSTIALELDTNPFLRADQPDVASAANTRSEDALSDPVAVFAAVRRWKDSA